MRRWIIVLAPLVPLALLLAYVRLSPAGQQARVQTPVAPLVEVVYVVRGTAETAQVTYSNAASAVEQRSVSLPWDFRMERVPGSAAYLSAQTQAADGSVICEILVGGARIAEGVGEGEGEAAMCGGVVP
jgi:hypothetical protein